MEIKLNNIRTPFNALVQKYSDEKTFISSDKRSSRNKILTIANDISKPVIKQLCDLLTQLFSIKSREDASYYYDTQKKTYYWEGSADFMEIISFGHVGTGKFKYILVKADQKSTEDKFFRSLLVTWLAIDSDKSVQNYLYLISNVINLYTRNYYVKKRCVPYARENHVPMHSFGGGTEWQTNYSVSSFFDIQSFEKETVFSLLLMAVKKLSTPQDYQDFFDVLTQGAHFFSQELRNDSAALETYFTDFIKRTLTQAKNNCPDLNFKKLDRFFNQIAFSFNGCEKILIVFDRLKNPEKGLEENVLYILHSQLHSEHFKAEKLSVFFKKQKIKTLTEEEWIELLSIKKNEPWRTYSDHLNDENKFQYYQDEKDNKNVTIYKKDEKFSQIIAICGNHTFNEEPSNTPSSPDEKPSNTPSFPGQLVPQYEALGEYEIFFDSLFEAVESHINPDSLMLFNTMLQDAKTIASATPARTYRAWPGSNIYFQSDQKCVSELTKVCIFFIKKLNRKSNAQLPTNTLFNTLVQEMLIRQFKLSVGDSMCFFGYTTDELLYDFKQKFLDAKSFSWHFKEAHDKVFEDALIDAALELLMKPNSRYEGRNSIEPFFKSIGSDIKSAKAESFQDYFFPKAIERFVKTEKPETALLFLAHIAALKNEKQVGFIRQKSKFILTALKNSADNKKTVSHTLKLHSKLWDSFTLWSFLRESTFFRALVDIDLSGNQITYAEMKKLTLWLYGSHLVSLDFSDNPIGKGNIWIGTSGAQTIIEALCLLKQLESLRLDRCALTDKDIETLVELENGLEKLSHLSLNGNHLGQYSRVTTLLSTLLKKQAEAFSNKATNASEKKMLGHLQQLELADNDIPHEGAIELLDAQSISPGFTPTQFNLTNNIAISEAALGVFRAQSKLAGQNGNEQLVFISPLTAEAKATQKRVLLWQTIAHRWNIYTEAVSQEGNSRGKVKRLLNSYIEAADSLVDEIKKQLNLQEFYQTFYHDLDVLLSEIIIIVSSGMIHSDLTFDIGYMGVFLSALVSTVPLVNSASPLIHVLSEYIGKQRQVNHAKNIIQIGYDASFKALSQRLALELTMSYQFILLALPALDKTVLSEKELHTCLDKATSVVVAIAKNQPVAAQKMGQELIQLLTQKVKEIPDKINSLKENPPLFTQEISEAPNQILQAYPKSAAKRLAEFMVMKLAIGCLSGKLSANVIFKTMLEALTDIVTLPSDQCTEVLKQEAKRFLNIGTVETQKTDQYAAGLKLILEDISSNMGVEDLQGNCKTAPVYSDVMLYLFRFSTQADAHRADLKPTVLDRKKFPPLIQLPLLIKRFLGLEKPYQNHLNFDTPYDDKIFRALFQSVDNCSQLIRVIFYDDVSFTSQLTALQGLTKEMSRPGIFLSRSPDKSYWTIGIVKGNNLFFIDPKESHLSKEIAYYQDLTVLALEASLQVYVASSTLLKSSLNTSDVIVTEIALQLISQLTPNQFEQWWNKWISADVASTLNTKLIKHLPFEMFKSVSDNVETLVELETLNDFDYQQNLHDIRQAHFEKLQQIDSVALGEKLSCAAQAVFERMIEYSEVKLKANTLSYSKKSSSNLAVPAIFSSDKQQISFSGQSKLLPKHKSILAYQMLQIELTTAKNPKPFTYKLAIDRRMDRVEKNGKYNAAEIEKLQHENMSLKQKLAHIENENQQTKTSLLAATNAISSLQIQFDSFVNTTKNRTINNDL